MALAEFLKQIDLDELYYLNTVRSTAQKAHEERGSVRDADISPCTHVNNGGGDGDGGESHQQAPTISTSSHDQSIDSSEVLPSGLTTTPVLSSCLPPRKSRRNKRPRDDDDDPAADTVFTPPKRLLRSTASVIGERLHSVIEELYDLVPGGKQQPAAVQDGQGGRLANGKAGGGGSLSTTEMVERAVEHLRKLQEGGLSSTSTSNN